MFTKSQTEYLLRRLQRNEVVLFVGAGFAMEAKNKLGENLPTGRQLSEKLWHFLGMKGDYDGTALTTLYELLLNKGKKNQEIKDFLSKIFTVRDFPEFYNQISLPYWHKIYTTNIDNLLEKIYEKSEQKVSVLKYPRDDFEEVDKALEKIQIVYLNGKLPCEPSELIFSKRQYARGANTLQPLYHQFVHDYATTTTIFLGTALDEPVFEQYIAAREVRKAGIQEYRPQSFLIDPYIPQAKEELLKTLYNIEPIKATTLEFIRWLKENEENFLSKEDTLKITFPSLAELYVKSSEKTVRKLGESFIKFSSSFSKVNPFGKAQLKNKNFLLGTSPTWTDIYNNLDAPRKITEDLFNKIEESIKDEPKKIKVLSLLGSAGCGKSTILKRLSLKLAQNGRTVFLSYSENVPDYNSIAQTINSLNEKVILVFDNADLMLPQLPKLVEELQGCTIPPFIFITTRTNIFDRITSKLDPIVNLKEFKTPNLDRDEIIEVLKRLEESNVLGHLKGMSQELRIKEFEQRSKKQILVAMREATKGENFDEIIKSEFYEIEPKEARFLATCVALTTEAGFTVSKQDLIGFSDVSPSETLYYLERNLNDIVLKAGSKEDRLVFRHRAIAEYIINNCLSQDDLRDIYLRILSSLAAEIDFHDWKSRKFALYKEIINHKNIYKRFQANIDNARTLYESLIQYFSGDYQFWLQYGSLECEGRGGSLELADNYLQQAASMKPNSQYVKNALANLYFKKSISVGKISEAIAYRDEANNILHQIFEDSTNEDPHSYHIYCTGNYNFIITNLSDKRVMRSEIEKLKSIIKQGIINNPVNKRLLKVKDTIERAYLLTATEGEVNYPIILSELEQ